MAIQNVPEREFHELVREIDEILAEGLRGVEWDKLDKSLLTKKYEERIGRRFDEFITKFPGENATKARNIAIEGIPAYISAAQKAKEYRNVTMFKFMWGTSLVVGGFMWLLGMICWSTHDPTLAYICGPSLIWGWWATQEILMRRDPLNVYRKQYLNQIIDAYRK